MKKWLLAFIILTLSLGLKAQSDIPHPFPADSAAWYDILKDDYNQAPSQVFNVKYYYGGDTLINNSTFGKVYTKGVTYCTNSQWFNPCPNEFNHYYQCSLPSALLRTDSNKVYVKYINNACNQLVSLNYDTSAHVLYDYNLQVGDSFKMDYNRARFLCVSIDSAITNVGYRKRWNLLINHDNQFVGGYQCILYDTLSWIEGTTSSQGVFYDLMFNECQASDIWKHGHTECFLDVDTFVLGGGFASCEYLLNDIADKPTQNKFSIFPNPATADFTVKTNASTQSLTVQLYNSLGQQVGSYSAVGNQLTIPRNSLPNGMYIAQIQSGRGVARQKVLLVD
jgi:hypothetical protein